MQRLPTPPFLNSFLADPFILKQDIQEFLGLDSETLDLKLQDSQQKIADLGDKDFDWSRVTDFYGEKVRELYLN